MSKKKENELADDEFPPTAPVDPRFPYCNITNYCYTMFVDYQKCTRLLGKGHEPCNYFKRVYTSLCPHAWVERWEEQIKEGVFPADLPEENSK